MSDIVCLRCDSVAASSSRYRHCIECTRASKREWYLKNRKKAIATQQAYKASNPDKVKAYVEKTKKQRSDRVRRKKYGDDFDFDKMLKSQNYQCKICGIADPVYGRWGWHVDHCHETKKVRGILCLKCNMGIGYLDHRPEKLRAAAKYLDDDTSDKEPSSPKEP